MKNKKQKGAIFVLFLFLASSIGASFLQSGGNENFGPELPKSHVMDELGDEQRALILGQNYFLVEFFKEKNCTDCFLIEKQLERQVNKFIPAIYLVTTQSSLNRTRIKISNYYSEETFSEFNETQIEDFICGNLPPTVDRKIRDLCVLRSY